MRNIICHLVHFERMGFPNNMKACFISPQEQEVVPELVEQFLCFCRNSTRDKEATTTQQYCLRRAARRHKEKHPKTLSARVCAMIPLLAAIVLAGAAGAGPILVSDACGEDTTTNSETGRCAVEEVERKMRAKKRPKELKVSALLSPSLSVSSSRSAEAVRHAKGCLLYTSDAADE